MLKFLYRPFDNQEPSILSYMGNGEIDLVINIPKTSEKVELDSDYIIRRKAVDLEHSTVYKCTDCKKICKSFKAISAI